MDDIIREIRKNFVAHRLTVCHRENAERIKGESNGEIADPEKETVGRSGCIGFKRNLGSVEGLLLNNL